jgi:Tir chaperone protein (CesT) family
MSRKDHTNAVLADLGRKIGLERLQLNSEGRTSLNFNDIRVTFEHRVEPFDTLWITAEIGSICADGIGAPLALLELNMRTWLGNVMTLCLGPDWTTVLGYTALSVATLDVERLYAVLGPFLEQAVAIRFELTHPGFGDPAAAPMPAPADVNAIRA